MDSFSSRNRSMPRVSLVKRLLLANIIKNLFLAPAPVSFPNSCLEKIKPETKEMKDKVPVRWRFILQVNNGKREDATAGENPKGNKEIWESREVSYENISRWTLSLETSLIRVYQSLFCEALGIACLFWFWKRIWNHNNNPIIYFHWLQHFLVL